MNRGIARRPTFEGERDMRCFLALLAMATRRFRIQVHAFCVMTTHFHLLVRSLEGQLSTAIGWIEQRYVRYFNRTRGRDGPLFWQRFTSRHVDSERYWIAVVRYLDLNPVEAKLVTEPWEYRYGSAWHYVLGSGPAWLTRTYVEARVCALCGTQRYDPSQYPLAWHGIPAKTVRRIVEDQSMPGSAWLRSRAQLADGVLSAVPVPAEAVLRHLDAEETVDPAWRVLGSAGVHRRPGWPILRAGLLREVCGLSLAEIGQLLGTSSVTIHNRIRHHRELLLADACYAARARVNKRAWNLG